MKKIRNQPSSSRSTRYVKPHEFSSEMLPHGSTANSCTQDLFVRTPLRKNPLIHRDFYQLQEKITSPCSLNLAVLHKLKDELDKTYNHNRLQGWLGEYLNSQRSKDYNMLQQNIDRRIEIEHGIQAINNYIEIIDDLPLTTEQIGAFKRAFNDPTLLNAGKLYLSELQKKAANIIQSHIQAANALITALKDRQIDLATFSILMEFYGRLKDRKITDPLQQIALGIDYVQVLLGGVSLPPNIRGSLHIVLQYPSLLVEHNRILSAIENRNKNAQEVAVESMVKNLTCSLQKKQISNDDFGAVVRLYNYISSLFEEKRNNVQFNSDSLASLVYRKDQAPPGTLDRWYSREESFWHSLKQQEPPSGMSEEEFIALKSQLSLAREIAKTAGLGDDTRWEVPDGSIGALVHAGWLHASSPQVGGEQKILKADRTIGLMMGERVVTGKVPLDFSSLKAMSYGKAKILIDIITGLAAKDEPTLSRECMIALDGLVKMGHLSEDEAEKAQPIIVKFIEDTASLIDSLHRQLQHLLIA